MTPTYPIGGPSNVPLGIVHAERCGGPEFPVDGVNPWDERDRLRVVTWIYGLFRVSAAWVQDDTKRWGLLVDASAFVVATLRDLFSAHEFAVVEARLPCE